MPIDFERKIIFVHIPKTAGTSVKRHLQLDHASFSYRIGKRVNSGFVNGSCNHWAAGIDLQHLTLSELLLAANVQDPQSFFKFTFLRDPVSRFLSEYHWRIRREFTKQYTSTIDRFIDYVEDFLNGNVSDPLFHHLIPQASFFDLQNPFNFVGNTDCVKTDLKQISLLLELKTIKGRPPVLNKSKSVLDITSSLARAIRELYEVDMDLIEKFETLKGVSMC